MLENRNSSFKYDVALSFAGEERDYVQKVANSLKNRIKFFYDQFEDVDLWGKDLFTHLDEVYKKDARYCVMFISKNYAKKLWTNHERQSAQERAFEENKEYILPVRFDDTEIPGIRSTVGYIDGSVTSPEQLADMIIEKCRSKEGSPNSILNTKKYKIGSEMEGINANLPVKKSVEWECRDDILTTANQNYVQTNSKCFGRNAIITITPVALDQRIDVNGIKLTLKYADNNEISDDTILTLRKGDKYIGNYSEIGKYEYGDLKRKVTLKNKASLSFYEILAIYLEENYIGKEIISETIKFYVDSCFKKDIDGDIFRNRFNMK